MLTELMRGKETNAPILASHGFPELALMYQGLSGKSDVVELLMRKKYVVISAVLSALLTDSQGPVIFLLRHAPHWAATVNAALNDQKAKMWLSKSRLDHYLILADAIHEKMDQEEGSGLDMLFRPPI